MSHPVTPPSPRSIRTTVATPSPLPGSACCEVQAVAPSHVWPLAEQLRSNLQGWEAPATTRRDAERTAWNARVKATHDLSKTFTHCSDERPVFAAVFQESPIGLMQLARLDGQKRLPITALVTHPGSQGTGWRLIEQAINTSAQAGLQGRLVLDAMSRSAGAAYRAMGFVADDICPFHMTLDPADRPDLWRLCSDGTWRAARTSGPAALT